MNIKIKHFPIIPYWKSVAIVSEYIKNNEKCKTTDGYMGIKKTVCDIKVTNKYPEKVLFGNSVYHVRCKKTKVSYMFDVWLAM